MQTAPLRALAATTTAAANMEKATATAMATDTAGETAMVTVMATEIAGATARETPQTIPQTIPETKTVAAGDKTARTEQSNPLI